MNIIGYVDPGVGGLIVQIIVASFLGGVAFTLRRIVALFRRKKLGVKQGLEENTNGDRSK